MAIPHAEKLIEKAKLGEHLTRKERLHAIAYLMAAAPETSNVEMGEIFHVSEGMIRADKKRIRTERAKIVKEDDVGLVIADIAMHFDRQVRDLEASKKKCKPGTNAYVNHCKVIFDLMDKYTRIMQELGFYPRNLGNMTVQKFEYKAVVTRDGAVDTRPMDLIIDNEGITEGEYEEVKLLPAPEEPK